MPINPNIAMGYRGVEIPQQNVLADYAAIQQIQGGRQAQELNALKMQQAQKEIQTQNVLGQAYAQATDPITGAIDYNKLTGLVAAGGGGAQLPGIQKSRLEAQTGALTFAEAQRKFMDKVKLELSSNPSDDNVRAFGQDAVIQGIYPKEVAEREVAQLLAMPPQQRAQILMQSGATAAERKPVTSVGPTGIVQTPAFGGAATVVPGTGEAFQMTPAQIAQNRIAQGQLNVAQQQLAQQGQGVTYQQDAQGNLMALPSRLSAGAVPTARPVTGEGGVAVKGKPSAFAEKAAAQKAQMGKDINQAIFELKSVVKPGGLIDQSTGSGAGRLYDIGAGFVGQAPEGAIAAGQLEPIADLVLKMVPRFEGPQSDKDTQSYKAAAGQLANSALPTKIRKAAANEIIRLMEARKTQFGSVDAGAPAGTGVDTSNPLLK